MLRSRAPLPRLRFLPVALALAAAPAVADVEVIGWTPGTPGGSGNFTGTTVASLSGDGYADVAMATGGDLVIAERVTFFAEFNEQSISGSAIDVATLPAAGLAVSDDRDHLVLAASDGLWTLREENGALTATAVDTSSGWQGVKRVLVADVDGDDDLDLVVLKSNGRSIDCKLQTSTGGWSDTSNYQWTANFDVLDLALGDVDGDSSDVELVVNDTRALRIFSPGNTLLVGYPSLRHDYDRMAIARISGGDCIAWVTAASTSTSDLQRHLFVVTTAGSTWCATTSDKLGPVVGGHIDDQPGGDLAFMVDGESTLRVLLQQSGPTPFDFALNHGSTTSLGGSSTMSAARPAVGRIWDADPSDGDVDEIVVPLASTEALAILPMLFSSTVTIADYSHDGHCADKDEFEDPDATVHIVAAYPGLGDLYSEGGWSVDATVWQRDPVTGAYGNGFVHSCRHALGDIYTSDDHLEIEFEITDDSDLYFILIRPLKVGTNPLQTRTAMIGVYTHASDDLAPYIDPDYIYPGLWTDCVDVHLCGESSPPRVGGFIRIRRFPPSIPPPANPPVGPCN